MKQIWPNYSYSPATNVLTLTGLNIDRDQLLLVTAADRGRIMYNFADSSVTASAFTSGANTALTLVATTAGLTTTAALVIYYDDQLQSTAVSISNLPSTQTIAGTVTANGGNFAYAQDEDTSNPSDRGVLIGWRDDANGSFRNTSDAQPLPISGTVTVDNSVTIGSAIDALNDYAFNYNQAWPIVYANTHGGDPFPISGTVTIGSALPTGTNRIGVVTIGAGTVTLGASTAQIGSVTANLAYSQTATTISSTAVTAIPVVFPTSGAYGGSLQGYNGTNTYIYSGIQAIGGTSLASATSLPVSLGSLPALVAGTAQIGSVTASISNSVVTFYPMQGTAVSLTTFNSTTSSTTLVSAIANREVLTVFNEGAGNLHISAGATCTTISYQVRLSAGDYWECPQGQLSLAHTAVFATAGTARVCQVS